MIKYRSYILSLKRQPERLFQRNKSKKKLKVWWTV